MQSFYILLLSLVSTIPLSGQNLIENWTFEQGLQLYCADWYDGCGNELTNNCDTISDCFVAFERESPSAIPEEQWSIRMRAGFGVEGKAETFITGQSGTLVYELSYFMKSPNWTSRVMLGAYSEGEYADSTYLDTTALEWSEFTIRDTLSTMEDDTIAVRLSAGFGDFCVCTAYFDLIRLRVLDTLTRTDPPEFGEHDLLVYPNPADNVVRFENGGVREGSYTIRLYSVDGKVIREVQATDPVIDMNVASLSPGLYLYKLVSPHRIYGAGTILVK